MNRQVFPKGIQGVNPFEGVQTIPAQKGDYPSYIMARYVWTQLVAVDSPNVLALAQLDWTPQNDVVIGKVQLECYVQRAGVGQSSFVPQLGKVLLSNLTGSFAGGQLLPGNTQQVGGTVLQTPQNLEFSFPIGQAVIEPTKEKELWVLKNTTYTWQVQAFDTLLANDFVTWNVSIWYRNINANT